MQSGNDDDGAPIQRELRRQSASGYSDGVAPSWRPKHVLCEALVYLRLLAMCSVRIPDDWKERVDFARACTSMSSLDGCWLISHLAAWNQLLYEISYELSESRPGKLKLRYLPEKCADNVPVISPQQTAALISWLVEHHICIEEVRILSCVLPSASTEQRDSAPIRLSPPPEQSIVRKMRCLEVQTAMPDAYTGPSSCYLSEEPPSLCGLECIRLVLADNRLDPGLISVLLRNSDSLRIVEITQPTLSRHMTDALHGLSKCESIALSFCQLQDEGGFGTDAVTRLLRRLPGLKKSTIYSLRAETWNVCSVADALRCNKTLTTFELYIHRARVSLKDLFAALEVNASLKTLRIGSRSVDASCGDALAAAISNNACLLRLDLRSVIADYCMTRLAEALLQNTTLEELHFTNSEISVQGALALCDALRTNKTLKELVFPYFLAGEKERAALADKLAHGDGYSRVRLPYLTEPDVSSLALLAAGSTCPVELDEIVIGSVSPVNATLIFDALSSSRLHARFLSVFIDQNQQEKVAAFCKVLKTNMSIRSVSVFLINDNGEFIEEVLSALNANQKISEVILQDIALKMETASALSDFFAHNRTVSKFYLSFIGGFCGPFLNELSRGLSTNPVIVELRVTEGRDHTIFLLSDTIRRNGAALNRALDFVVRRGTDRGRAESFEIFSETPGFVAHLTKAAGLTEHEAAVAIGATKNFLWDNYFVVTGVVQHSVVCYPAHGTSTQCDKLNMECWRAIVRHLKVTDVLA